MSQQINGCQSIYKRNKTDLKTRSSAFDFHRALVSDCTHLLVERQLVIVAVAERVERVQRVGRCVVARHGVRVRQRTQRC